MSLGLSARTCDQALIFLLILLGYKTTYGYKTAGTPFNSTSSASDVKCIGKFSHEQGSRSSSFKLGFSLAACKAAGNNCNQLTYDTISLQCSLFKTVSSPNVIDSVALTMDLTKKQNTGDSDKETKQR